MTISSILSLTSTNFYWDVLDGAKVVLPHQKKNNALFFFILTNIHTYIVN